MQKQYGAHAMEEVQLEPEYYERVIEVPKVHVEHVERIVEVPQPQIVDRIVEIPQVQEIVREIPGDIEVRIITREVPKIEVRQVERIVEVPQIEYQDRYVEVEEIREVVRRVPRVEVHEIPIERIIRIPKKIIQEIEQPIYRPVPHLVQQRVEREIPIPKVQVQTMEVVRQIAVPMPQEGAMGGPAPEGYAQGYATEVRMPPPPQPQPQAQGAYLYQSQQEYSMMQYDYGQAPAMAQAEYAMAQPPPQQGSAAFAGPPAVPVAQYPVTTQPAQSVTAVPSSLQAFPGTGPAYSAPVASSSVVVAPAVYLNAQGQPEHHGTPPTPPGGRSFAAEAVAPVPASIASMGALPQRAQAVVTATAPAVYGSHTAMPPPTTSQQVLVAAPQYVGTAASVYSQGASGQVSAFDMLDRNHDGVLSRAEFSQAQAYTAPAYTAQAYTAPAYAAPAYAAQAFTAPGSGQLAPPVQSQRVVVAPAQTVTVPASQSSMGQAVRVVPRTQGSAQLAQGVAPNPFVSGYSMGAMSTELGGTRLGQSFASGASWQQTGPLQGTMFDQLDTNHDGVLSRDEFNRAMAPAAPAEPLTSYQTIASPLASMQSLPGEAAASSRQFQAPPSVSAMVPATGYSVVGNTLPASMCAMQPQMPQSQYLGQVQGSFSQPPARPGTPPTPPSGPRPVMVMR